MFGTSHFAGALTAVLLAALLLDRAFAVDVPDPYPGRAIGRLQVRATANPASDFVVGPARFDPFKGKAQAVSVMAGLLPVPLLAVESTGWPPGAGICSTNQASCNLQPFRLDRSDTSPTGGRWSQVKLGSLTLPVEYKRFTAVSGSELSTGVKETRLALRAVAAPRLGPFLGAELAHVDLGQASGHSGSFPTDVSRKATAAFGVVYLPLPPPVLDVYLEAGLARLKSTSHLATSRPGVGSCPWNDTTCRQTLELDRIDTGFAGGAGVQFRLGSWALHGEYRQFIAAGGHPGFVSLGLTWNFL
jgi:hypothetical protein